MSPNPPSHSTSTHLQCVSVHTHSYTHLLSQTTNSNRKPKHKREILSKCAAYIYFLFKWWMLGWEPAVKVPLAARVPTVPWKSDCVSDSPSRPRWCFQPGHSSPHTSQAWPREDSSDNTLSVLSSEVEKKKASQSTDQEPWWLLFWNAFLNDLSWSHACRLWLM